ncbi:MAG: hypothetical protein WBZ36_13835, partial [Candidatus Nitrosopolaris sp.]
QAADMIANILNEINDDNMLARSDKINNIVFKFSIQNYKKNLNNIIDYVIKRRKVEEAVILNKTRTRLSAPPGVSHTGGTGCTVSVLLNDVKAYQKTVALGHEAKGDYSVWHYNISRRI